MWCGTDQCGTNQCGTDQCIIDKCGSNQCGTDECGTDDSHGVARLNFGMHQIFSRLPFRNRLKPIQRENPKNIRLLSFFEIASVN